MSNTTTQSTLTHLRPILSVAIGVLLGLGLACDLGGDEGPCDTMCNEGPIGSVDEIAEQDTLTCSCGTNTPSDEECEAYCVEMGGSAENAFVDGQSCVCSGLE